MAARFFSRCVRAISAVGLSLALVSGGCSTTPKTETERASLEQKARATLTEAQGRDPSLRDFLNRSYGYAVFPDVGKGGLILAGAYGRGVVFERGNIVGYADVTQGTIGAQVGGQSFSQIICFQTPQRLNDFKYGNFSFSGNASAVAIRAGAAAATDFTDGTAVFTFSEAGLMVEAAIGGQRFSYQPLNAVPPESR